MSEEMIILIAITMVVILIFLLPIVYIVTNKLVSKGIQTGYLDEKKLKWYLERFRKVRFRRHVLNPIKYGCVASTILFFVLGLVLKEIRLVIFSIFPMVYRVVCRYILKKKGRW